MIRENLKLLRRLQEVELAIRNLQNDIEIIPHQMEDIKHQEEENKKLLEEEKKNKELSQKKRRQLEADLEDFQAKKSKYNEQLLQVKTNKEYQAMLRELETIEQEISDSETQVIIELEREDEIDKNIVEKEKEFIEQQKVGNEEKEKLNAKLKKLKEELEKLMKHKKHYEKQVPKDLLETYDQIKSAREGIALAEVKDSICQICHVRLPPQFYNDIKANKKLFTCANCNRILYFKAEEKATS